MKSRNVALIFRKKNSSSFSIEKVFETLIPILKESISLSLIEAPIRSAGPIDVVRNIIAIRKLNASVFHITGDIHYAVFAFPRNRTLLTVHDCVFLKNSKGIKRQLFKWLWLQWPVWYVKKVIAISEKTKQEIIAFTGCKAEKILVIPNPVNHSIHYVAKKFNKIEPVILFIGTKSNKNLPRSIKALEGIPCILHIIGEINDDQKLLLSKSNVKYNSFSNLTDTQVAALYQGSDMVLFPSLYEGFGLPVIEAQQAGRPVITSNISPMIDIAGKGAHFVDPLSIESIRKGVLKVIQDEEYRKQLCEIGFKNALLYTPDKIAACYMRTYETFF